MTQAVAFMGTEWQDGKFTILPLHSFSLREKSSNQYFTIHKIAPFIEAYHLEFTPSQGYF
jgi:hypothetical protein